VIYIKKPENGFFTLLCVLPYKSYPNGDDELRKRRFDNKIVLLTGASSGIGYALALELANQGAKLVLVARRIDRLKKLVEKIKDSGGQAICFTVDVTKGDDLNTAVKLAQKEFGLIDIVVANAAIPIHGNFDQLATEDYKHIFETNVFGILNTAYAGLNDLKKSKGSIVIIGSGMAYMTTPGTSAYSMGKFAIRAFAETTHNELRKYGIKVMLINPGFVESEIRLVDNNGKFNPKRKDWVPSFLVMPADKAAKKIAKAIYKGKREKFIGLFGYLGYWFRQYTPWLYFMLLNSGDKIVRNTGNK
jgi:short-subunit dehydrogenase